MGSFLDKPVTEKETINGEGNDMIWGCSAMQGWRVDMEVSAAVMTKPCASHFSTYSIGDAPSTAVCPAARATWAVACGCAYRHPRWTASHPHGRDSEKRWWFLPIHFGPSC